MPMAIRVFGYGGQVVSLLIDFDAFQLRNLDLPWLSLFGTYNNSVCQGDEF